MCRAPFSSATRLCINTGLRDLSTLFTVKPEMDIAKEEEEEEEEEPAPSRRAARSCLSRY